MPHQSRRLRVCCNCWSVSKHSACYCCCCFTHFPSPRRLALPPASHPHTSSHTLFTHLSLIRCAAHINSTEEYFRKHQKSLVDPDAFWANIANDFQWKKKVRKDGVSCSPDCLVSRHQWQWWRPSQDVTAAARPSSTTHIFALLPLTPLISPHLCLQWDKVVDYDFHKGHIKWFEGAELNVSRGGCGAGQLHSMGSLLFLKARDAHRASQATAAASTLLSPPLPLLSPSPPSPTDY